LPRGHRLATFALSLVVVGCGLLPTGSQAAHIDNMTNTPMAVHIDGVWAGTYAPGTSADVPLVGHGAPPYAITVHSPSGGVLMQLVVSADDYQMAAEGTGSVSGDTELPCGTVRLSVGRIDLAMPEVADGDLPTCP
jgi:hypothetical protein